MTDDENKSTIIDFKEAKGKVRSRRKDDAKPETEEKKLSDVASDDYGFKAAWERAQPMLKEAKRKNFNEHVVYYVTLFLVVVLHVMIFALAVTQSLRVPL